jgi:hypothetical protein
MAMADIYYLHGIYLPSAALISELTDATASTNTDETTLFSAGHPHVLLRAVRGQQPDFSFSCTAVKQILDLMDSASDYFSADLTAGNTDLEFRRGKHVSHRYAINVDAPHIRFRAANAFLWWNTLSATHQQDATIDCRIVAVSSDGVTAPISYVSSGTLQGTPAVSQLFTLGPININGSALTGVQEWSLATGITEELVGSDIIVTVTLNDTPWNDRGLAGTKLDGVNGLNLYLRKKDPDGGNVANATAQHVKIIALNGLVLPEDSRTGANDPDSSTLRILIRSTDGSTAPLTISTVSAIT